jgi:LysM repeat protein
MLDDICVTIPDKEISAKLDEDGERRIIDIDISLDLDIKCYNDEKIEILADAYALNCNLNMQNEILEYETVLLKNNTTFRVEESIELRKDSYDVLQVCNSAAVAKIDEVSICDNGIEIEGVVEVNIIYISTKDNCPINSVKEMVPFNHIIEVENITKDSKYSIKPYVEQVNVLMSSGSTFEVKVSVNVDTIVFLANSEVIVTDIEQCDIDKKAWNNMASMTGYIVKENDNLWDIAKKFYTTVDMLKKTNKIVDKDIQKGDKLLIIKSRL